MGWYPIEEILAIVRESPSATLGLARLLDLCQRHWPSSLWTHFRAIDAERDVTAAAEWLREQLSDPQAAAPLRGLYLGLDTLNMDDGAGKNVEIGGTARADAEDAEGDWLYALEWYGKSHLIAGLLEMHTTYSHAEWKAHFASADYVLFLGYSGLVLMGAAERIAWRDDTVLVWGFHDGDMFSLARGTEAGLQRLAVM